MKGADINAISTAAAGSLSQAVQRVESIRDIKDLQRQYAHLGQLGRWSDQAELFLDDAVVAWGADVKTGTPEITEWLRQDAARWSGRGALHTELIDQPLVNLSADGSHAKCRWHSMRFLGDGEGEARIEAGIYENEYQLTGDGWKISRVEHTPLYGGDYKTGWVNAEAAGVPIVPRHFTPDQVGAPVGPTPQVQSFGADPEGLDARIRRLGDEDDVRNLQHALGYYIDRKMWTDAEELFVEDARYRVDDVEHLGVEGIGRALRRMGAEGLEHGELNDHLILDVIVDVRPGGREAYTRGLEVALIGDTKTGSGSWEFSILRSRMIKADGLWRLQETATTRLLHADYAVGWGRGGVEHSGERDDATSAPILDLVRRVPGDTGHPITEPDDPTTLRDMERRLTRSLAYDGVENISAAYGYYLDDFQWPEMAALFAGGGHKQSPFAGYYLGPDRILEAATAGHGAPKPPDALRERAVFHWRPQSVIMVSHDGRSANLRTRLFQTRTSATVAPGWTGVHSGSYANDQAVLEDGVWRLWSVTIDEYYFTSPTWSGGWASAQDRTADTPAPPRSKLLDICPPDIRMDELGERMHGIRGGTGRAREWPEIVPMWFHYRNPVSGRVPDHYWPDCVPSELAPHTRMSQHGYQTPPTGPAVDGVDLA